VYSTLGGNNILQRDVDTTPAGQHPIPAVVSEGRKQRVGERLHQVLERELFDQEFAAGADHQVLRDVSGVHPKQNIYLHIRVGQAFACPTLILVAAAMLEPARGSAHEPAATLELGEP